MTGLPSERFEINFLRFLKLFKWTEKKKISSNFCIFFQNTVSDSNALYVILSQKLVILSLSIVVILIIEMDFQNTENVLLQIFAFVRLDDQRGFIIVVFVAEQI
jgi:hypothetical protein